MSAWRWLPEYQMGVATKADVVEVYAPRHVVVHSFTGFIVLLCCIAVAIMISSWKTALLQKKIQAAVLDAKQLSQYSLGEKLGEGGKGQSTVLITRCSADRLQSNYLIRITSRRNRSSCNPPGRAKRQNSGGLSTSPNDYSRIKRQQNLAWRK